MENIYKDAIQLGIKNKTKKVSTKDGSTKVGSIDSFKVVAPILEGIIEGIQNKKPEQIISELYIGVSGVWGDIDNWPNAIRKFYGQLNYKVDNPESLVCIESKERMVIQAIKNKWLSTTGVSFKGRFERLKLLGEKNIREDGTIMDTKIVKKNVNGEIKLKVVRRMGPKDYKIKGIEEHGRPAKFKVIQKGKDKGKEEFIEFVK